MAFPPLDIFLAMVVMFIAAIALGASIARVLRRKSTRTASVGAALAVALLVLHAVWLNGNPRLAQWVGSPDAIVWSNLSPLFAAVLVACAWWTMGVRWQRWLVLIVVSTVCLTQAYGPLFGRVSPTKPARVTDGVHRQSTLATCSAAAAATLLETIGIATNETEMAALCLTRTAGTFQLGLYRGLRLKAPGSSVEFLNDDLQAVVTSPRPVIVSVGIDPIGWSLLPRRVGHSVVIIGHTNDGQLDIADPLTGGRYLMTPDAFKDIWMGEAMRLVPANR